MPNVGKRLTDMVTGGEARDKLYDELNAVDYRPEEGPPVAPIPPDEALPATGMVVRFRKTKTVIRIRPVVEIDLVVLAPDTVPRPLTLQLEVSLEQIPRLQPGARVGVTLSRLDRTRGTIDWDRTPT
jgi:hypothetical protein